MMIVLLLMLQLKVPDAANFVGGPLGKPITGVQLSHRTTEVAGLVRCPVCQGMSVADSPSEMAVNMKEQVRELLARGYTEKQILQYFELSYGQFVLLRPKFSGVNAAVWLLPIVGLIAGIAVVFMTVKNLGRRSVAAVAGSPVPENSDPYMARVRQLVAGDKPQS